MLLQQRSKVDEYNFIIYTNWELQQKKTRAFAKYECILPVFWFWSGSAWCSAHKTDNCHQPTKSVKADNMYLMYIDIDVKIEELYT